MFAEKRTKTKRSRKRGTLAKMMMACLSLSLRALPILLILVSLPDSVTGERFTEPDANARANISSELIDLSEFMGMKQPGDTVVGGARMSSSEQRSGRHRLNQEEREKVSQETPDGIRPAIIQSTPLPASLLTVDQYVASESRANGETSPPSMQFDIFNTTRSFNAERSNQPEVNTQEEIDATPTATNTTKITITRPPTITLGSHYQMTESRNLVQLEKIPHRSVHVALDSEKVSSKAQQDISVEETNKPLGSSSTQTGRQKLKRGPRSAGPSSTGETQLSSSQRTSNTVRAVLGQRLVIPCSNLSSLTTGDQQQQGSARRLSSTGSSANQRLRTTGSKPQVANGQGVSVIMWYKDEQLNSPIFFVDARGASSLREAKQQTGADSLRGRVHLEESTRLDSRGKGSTPALVIDEAQLDDSGLYTCTIEFYKAPTQKHEARVELINPPRNMLIRDDSNKALAAHLIGPYDEESRLKLTCEVEAGDPKAQLSWWQLQSVSPLVARSHTALAAKTPPSGKVDDKPESRMVTMTLDAGNSVGAEENQIRDYLVAVHSGQMSLRNLALPFSEGHSLRHWALVHDQTISSSSGRLQSTFKPSLSRENLWDEFICCAWSDQFASALNASVKVDLNLKPETVQIVNKSAYVFKLGQKAIVECHVQGSKPSAKVRWFRGSQELETASLLSNPQNSEYELNQNYISEFNRDTNNLTKISYLTLVPQLSDNQQSLTCSASNPKLPNAESLSDTITMSVQFPARLNLQLGVNMKADSIKVGNDVILECNVQSNPPINDLTWLFNGRPLANNISAGIIISDQTLVLQHVAIEQRGQYQCAAQNSMGKSYSNKLDLKPKFAPVCDHSLTKTKYEVGVNQPMKVECHVLAEPDDDIHFVWQFNQTFTADRDGDSTLDYRLDDIKQYETNLTRSHVIFTPKTRRNYGQLLCSASNSIGDQEKPCVIQVLPSELPDPVFGCFFDNLTDSSFGVHCQTPQSSSSRQNYLLELYTNDSQNRDTLPAGSSGPVTHLRQREESRNESLDDEEQMPHEQQQVKRLSSETPSFEMTDLQPDTSYNIMIYVQNAKGRSAPAFYQTSTLPLGKVSELSMGHVHLSNKRLAMEPSLSDRVMSYLNVKDYRTTDRSKLLIAIAIILLLCTIAVIAIVFSIIRHCRPSSGQKRRNQRHSLDSGETKLKAYDRRKPQVDTTVRLTPADSARMKALAGSGSDTSRETNTDSTLVPSLRADGELSIDRLADEKGQVMRQGTLGRFSRESPAQSVGQKHYLNSSNNHSPLLLSLSKSSTEQKLQSVYSTMRQPAAIGSPLEMEMSHTPQMSMKSESDCTSNRDGQPIDETIKTHNQILLKCQENHSEPIYVISRKGLLTSQCVAPQQIRLIDPSNLWPQRNSIDNQTNNGSISAGTQVSSIGTSDSFDRNNPTAIANTYNFGHCQVFNNSDMPQNETHLNGPINYLPASMSIPVSLSSCIHSRDLSNQHHRLSHDFLAGDVCLAGTNGSFLTLAPDGQTRYRHETLRSQQPQLTSLDYEMNQGQDIADISPPINFASNQNHGRVSLDIDDGVENSYCVKTLDNSHRVSRKLNGCSTRGSFDDNLIQTYSTQPQKHHVRFDPHNILYDPMTMNPVVGPDPQSMPNKEDMTQQY